jgi:hypothetical protein
MRESLGGGESLSHVPGRADEDGNAARRNGSLLAHGLRNVPKWQGARMLPDDGAPRTAVVVTVGGFPKARRVSASLL